MLDIPDWAVTERRSDQAHEEARLNYAERMAAEEARLADEFKAAVLAGNVDVCIHGRMAGDRVNGVYLRNARPELLWETMFDMLSYRDMGRITMRALALLARKGEIEATDALDALAKMYGQQNAEIDE